MMSLLVLALLLPNEIATNPGTDSVVPITGSALAPMQTATIVSLDGERYLVRDGTADWEVVDTFLCLPQFRRPQPRLRDLTSSDRWNRLPLAGLAYVPLDRESQLTLPGLTLDEPDSSEAVPSSEGKPLAILPAKMVAIVGYAPYLDRRNRTRLSPSVIHTSICNQQIGAVGRAFPDFLFACPTVVAPSYLGSAVFRTDGDKPEFCGIVRVRPREHERTGPSHETFFVPKSFLLRELRADLVPRKPLQSE